MLLFNLLDFDTSVLDSDSIWRTQK